MTNETNVELLRRWKQDDAAYLDILRYVRVSSEDPNIILVSRPGKHQNLVEHNSNEDKTTTSMDGLRFSSTIQGMDEIP